MESAIVWTVVIGLIHLAATAVALTAGRRRRWPSVTALAVLAVSALVGYGAVLYATVFPF